MGRRSARRGRPAAAVAAAVAVLAAGCGTGARTTGSGRTSRPVPRTPAAPARPAAPSGAPSPAPDCMTAKCVALTFDDGPTRYTAALLGMLERARVPATFFVIGPHALRYRQDVLRAYRDGDEIGDHTVYHPRLTRVPPARIAFEIDTAARQIASVIGRPPSAFRPPFGAVDDAVLAAARRARLPVVKWNDDPRDWRHHNPPLIERQVLAQVRPGAIVDLHDRYATTPPAIPPIIAALKARGYTLVTVDQLFAATGGLRPGRLYFHGP